MAEILIVEDNEANMRLARLLLVNAGHSVLWAADAETGLTLAREKQPALILMDIQLPGMDGLAATVLLKKDPATAGIPVLALTAMAMKEDREKTTLAGCDAYIAKPLRYLELYEKIDMLLAMGKPHADNEPVLAHPSP
jgi:two-component system cell cycle response regulator DivK